MWGFQRGQRGSALRVRLRLGQVQTDKPVRLRVAVADALVIQKA